MRVSRRRFVRDTSISLTFLLARLEGLPLWALPAEDPNGSCALHTGSGYAPFIGSFLDQIEPGADAFPTERYADELRTLLEHWSTALQASPTDLRAVALCLASTLNATPLGRIIPMPVRTHSPLQTERVQFGEIRSMTAANFLESLGEYLHGFRKIEGTEWLIGDLTEKAGDAQVIQTSVYYDLCGTLQDGRREQRTGEWTIEWRQTSSPAHWTITQWTAVVESRARLTGGGFKDVTGEAFRNIASFQEQLSHGTDYWRTVLDGATGIDVYGNNGIAAGDFDGDGFDDLYVCQPAGLPNRLYRNRGDGTFEDVTEKAGVGVLDGTASALFVDLNNNGLQDLIVVRTTGPLLFINRGDGTFAHKPEAFQFARASQGTFTAAAAADYDGDGLLDVYFCLYSYYQGLSEYQFPRPYYDAVNGPPNFLFKNRGDHTFEDVTARSGIDGNNNRYSFACGWNDFNQDGHPDLYVANDFGRKNMYRNNGDGTFTDVSASLGVEDPGAGMSVCWFDYDNDGFDDLYVANMWVAEGKRVSQQPAFLPTAPESIRRVYRKHADGNSLFKNTAGKGFKDSTDASHTRLGGWSWSADAWDLDHDGFPDLYVTNGFVSGPKRTDLSSFFWRQVVARSLASGGSSNAYEDAWSAVNEFLRSDYTWSGFQRNNVYLNNNDGTFTEAGGVLGLGLLDDCRAFALADFNQDGRVEVAVKSRTSPQLRLLKNDMEALPPSIRFALQGTRSNRDAIGAVAEVSAPSGRQRRSVAAGSGFLSQHSKVLAFGLGQLEAGVTVDATIHWPSGATQQLHNLPVNHTIHVVEAAGLKATPFRPAAAHPGESPQGTSLEDPSAPTETWLVDPILAPQFALPDAHGTVQTLAGFQGKPLVLGFVRSNCAQSLQQLQAWQKAWPAWQAKGMGLLVVRVDEPSSGDLPAQTWNFPVVAADATTSAVYNIFYRYLFERRRDMPLPTTFLLDASGHALKVYSGLHGPARMLDDATSAPSTSASRLKKAMPFPGRYFGGDLHHNYFTYGVAYFRYGFLDQALASFQQATARDPGFAGAFYNIGLIALQKKQMPEARANLEKAVALDPDNANAWNNLGVVYGNGKRYDQARTSFERALALRPGHLLALQNLVKLFEAQGHADQARDLLTKALAANPDEASLHVGLAVLLVQGKDLSGAQAEFESAVKLQPRNAEALNGLGVVLMKQGLDGQAMQRFGQCIQVAPSMDRPYLNIALLYLRAGNPSKAHDVLAGYLQHQPDSADVRRALREVDSRR